MTSMIGWLTTRRRELQQKRYRRQVRKSGAKGAIAPYITKASERPIPKQRRR